MKPNRPTDALASNPADAEPIELQTGYLDDVRQILTSEHPQYRRFAWARAHQREWSDGEHRDFWLQRLHLWPRSRGAHSISESVAFALAVGLSDGFALDELVGELPYRTRDTIRDKHLKSARKWQRLIEGRDLRASGVVRLPVVYVQGEERWLPQPPGIGAAVGWINLPVHLAESSVAVGDGALEAFNEVCGALDRLRQRRGWPDLRAQVARCTRVELCEEPIQSQRGSEPPVGELGCDPFVVEASATVARMTPARPRAAPSRGVPSLLREVAEIRQLLASSEQIRSG